MSATGCRCWQYDMGVGTERREAKILGGSGIRTKGILIKKEWLNMTDGVQIREQGEVDWKINSSGVVENVVFSRMM